ncbi:MAG: HD domain-containing protein [Nitrospirae bacterium]|nr:HD domain-containing protein [Nitrospirota bacterium]
MMRDVLLKQMDLLVETVRQDLGGRRSQRDEEAANRLWEETRETRRLVLESLERMDKRAEENRKDFLGVLERITVLTEESRRRSSQEEAARAAEEGRDTRRLMLEAVQKMDERSQESRQEFASTLERITRAFEQRPQPAPDEFVERRDAESNKALLRLVLETTEQMGERSNMLFNRLATFLGAPQAPPAPRRYGIGMPDPRLSAPVRDLHPAASGPQPVPSPLAPALSPAVRRDFQSESFLAGQRYENLRFHLTRTMAEASAYKALLIAPAIEKALQVVIDDIPENNSAYLDRIFHCPPASYKRGFKLHHCLNVGLISAMLGHELGLSRWELFELALGGFFHDIGMLDRRWAFILEPRELRGPERKLIRIHPMEAQPFFRNIEKDFPLLPVIAVQHHEREDGSGYPYAIRGEEIHPWSKIVGMADEMEALARPRPQRAARPILEFFASRSDPSSARFSSALWKASFRCVTLYPPGSRVLLSSGSQGTVVQVNPDEPLRPVVRVETQLRPGTQPRYLDLRASPQLRIIQLAA